MTHLNTIIEEETLNEIANTVYEPFDTTMPGAIHTYGQIPGLNVTVKKHLTTAMQRAYEAGRADWLRSEIEKLEGMKLKDKKEYPKLFPREWADCCWEGEMNGYNQALTTIITRYKDELKVLESNQYETT